MDADECVDCLAYRVLHETWLTYYSNIRTLAERDEHWSGLPMPPAKPRPAPHGGPRSKRCTTHWRAKRTRDRAASHARRTLSVYTLPIAEYEALKEFQNGKCAICQRATGKTKRLAVDHDHTCCSGKTSCGDCVRGLLCGPCNSMLAHLRDDKASFQRAWRYLTISPYDKMKIGGTWS